MTNAKVELSMKELESIISALKFKLAHLRSLGIATAEEVQQIQNIIDMLQAELVRLRSLAEEEKLEEQLEEMEEAEKNGEEKKINLITLDHLQHPSRYSGR